MNNNTKARVKARSKAERRKLAAAGEHRKSRHAKVAWKQGKHE